MTTGRFLKGLREGKNLSQMDVARWFGHKTPQYVSNVERGICAFPTHWVSKLCLKLKIEPLHFIEMLVLDYELKLQKLLLK